MELRNYINLALRHWWLLVTGPLIAGVVAFIFTELQPDVYQAEATLLVNQTQTPRAIGYQDILASEQLTNTYAELIQYRPVLIQVINQLGLPYSEKELRSATSVAPIRDTQLFVVKVKDPNPVLAADIANELTRALIRSTESELSRPGAVKVAEPASVPLRRTWPKVFRNTLLAVMVGLLASGGVILLIEQLDDSVKSVNDLAGLDIAALGIINRFQDSPDRRKSKNGPAAGPVPALEPWNSPAAEQYRLLRTNILFTMSKHLSKLLLVTGGMPREGKSTTAANLAAVLAQSGYRTVLVDSDLRHPVLHRYFGVANEQGLSTLLQGRSNLETVLQETNVENLLLIPSGPTASVNPAELLGSEQMKELLDHLGGNVADVVVLDSPPLNVLADASILAGMAKNALLIVEARKTSAQSVRQSVQALRGLDVSVLGAVLNKANVSMSTYQRYYQKTSEATRN